MHYYFGQNGIDYWYQVPGTRYQVGLQATCLLSISVFFSSCYPALVRFFADVG